MIDVKGVSQAKRILLSLVPKAKAAIQELTLNTAIAMTAEAEANAARDTGELAASIHFTLTRGGMGFILLADAPHWAYVEFGTGGLVEIPAGYEALAAQYRGKGIKEVNLPARPFLIPAYVAHSEIYLQNVKRNLPRLLR
ncbi:HK97 gp10 family phage protein [Fibrella forsythiae]|uniref:HK97 gp10 family phage protein n=1 Tax=Fibrella forsythiae TaxID=2817061 RepID=A0ABS3JBZ3_9BACT|nr:HK97 gp10 family phage protein [Fibrella forsythiae]MBO0947524.1 HK97 gp10 family phage protein [Fibrella forsythiae]